jgi:hypothetical protein
MNSQLAYEIGAVFLLAALLMFGSVRGFSGRFRLGGGTMVALGVALVAFGVYHYWDQILAFAAPDDSAAHVSAPASAPQANSAPAKHRSNRAPESGPIGKIAPESGPIERIIVIEEVPSGRVMVPAAADKVEAPDPCEKSPYESKARRALKSVGCGLHIIRKKDAQHP